MNYLKLFENFNSEKEWEIKALILLCVYRGILTDIKSVRSEHTEYFRKLLDDGYIDKTVNNNGSPPATIYYNATEKVREFIDDFKLESNTKLSINQLILTLSLFIYESLKYSTDTEIKDIYIMASEDIIPDTSISLTPKGRKLAMSIGYELKLRLV